MTNHSSKTKQIAAAALALLCLSGCTGEVAPEEVSKFVSDCQQKGGTSNIEGYWNLIFPTLNFSCSLPASSAQPTTKE